MKFRIFVLYLLLAGCSVSAATKPNIVVIFADDLGPGDINTYHQERTGELSPIPTPVMDSLINDGMRFDVAYAPNSLCAPSRFSMLTGNYSWRNYSPFGSWMPYNKTGILPKFTTTARIAKAGGYATSFFGKWGCGGRIKTASGEVVTQGNNHKADWRRIYDAANHHCFDYSYELPSGIQNTPLAFYENGRWDKLKPDSTLKEIGPEQSAYAVSRKHNDMVCIGDSNWDPSIVGPRLASKAVAYIKRHMSKRPKEPFFMYYCSQAVHIPHTPINELGGIKIAGSTPGVHGDMVKELDAQIGLIIKALKETGAWENTLFIVTSDNGGLAPDKKAEQAGHDPTNGFRGIKGSIFEGGSRVPFIAVWPGKIKPGSISSEPVVGHDIVATLAHLAGQPFDQEKIKDSINLVPLMTGKIGGDRHEAIMYQASFGPRYAIRKGDLKLIVKAESRNNLNGLKPIALFDLRDNPQEKEEKNLIENQEYKDKVEELLNKYLEHRNTGQSTVDASTGSKQ